MATKYNYTTTVINKNGEKITLYYSDGTVLSLSTGRAFPCTLKIFRGIAKENGGTITRKRNLQFGEYINVKTGKTEKLWGID